MRHLNDDAAFEEGAALEASRGAHASSPAPHAATFSCAFEMEIRLVVAPAMAPKDTRGVVVRRPVESAGAATETEAEDGRSVGASMRRALHPVALAEAHDLAPVVARSSSPSSRVAAVAAFLEARDDRDPSAKRRPSEDAPARHLPLDPPDEYPPRRAPTPDAVAADLDAVADALARARGAAHLAPAEAPSRLPPANVHRTSTLARHLLRRTVDPSRAIDAHDSIALAARTLDAGRAAFAVSRTARGRLDLDLDLPPADAVAEPPRDDDEFGDPDGDPEYFAPSRETRTSLDAAAAAEAEDDARLAEAADCTEAMAYRIKAAEAAAGSTAVRIRDAAEDASFAFAVGKGKNGVRRTERADHGTRTFDLDAGSAGIVTVRGYVPESGSPANPSRPRPSSFAHLPRRAHGPDDVRSFGDAPSFSPSFSPSAPLSPSPFARRVGPRTPAGALVDECLEETRFAAARDGERAARFEHPSPGSPPRRAWRRRRGGVERGGDGSGRGGEKRGGGVGGVGDGSGRGYDALFPPIRGERATRPSPKRLGVDNAATVTATTWGRAAATTTNANVNADANGAPRWGTPEKLSGMKRTPSAAREVRLASVPRSPAASASRGTKDETTRARNQNSGGVESGLGLGFGFGSRLESRLGEGFGPRVRDDSRRNGEGRDDFFAVTERFRYGA